MAEEETERKKPRPARKITRQRLKNIALYYLQRFETSSENLKAVLLRRVNVYAFQNPDWNLQEAVGWIDEIVAQFEGYGYVDDARFAEMKIKDYLAAGKSVRYIKGKLRLRGLTKIWLIRFWKGRITTNMRRRAFGEEKKNRAFPCR